MISLILTIKFELYLKYTTNRECKNAKKKSIVLKMNVCVGKGKQKY